jgi:adenine-specific DNA-methyltransferase
MQAFQNNNFINGLKSFFKDLKVPINYIDDQATTAQEILKDTYKENDVFQLINEVYFVGMVDDAAFEGNESLDKNKIKSDYDGVLIFGVTLKQRENNLLPTRSQLAEISRAFNREFYYTPAIVVFKYSDKEKEYLAFANTERLKYKQEWREGEKAGKVTLLRDVDVNNTHRGHLDILNKLQLPDIGNKKVDSFDKLYKYWQEVFSVSVLNKKFYQDLSNWYFWAIKQVRFPNEPTFDSLQTLDQKKLDEAINEHQAKNVIRLLTRLLFTWFIKEKGLIPEELFDLKSLQDKYLNDIAPLHEENSLFKEANKESIYYKSILQNLFFASLNCPIQADGSDTRERGFRGNESYGKHRGVDHLMRYEKEFKDPQLFLKMMNETVPFLNGGLFECLDDKLNNVYIDGFSDQMTKGEQLIVPDYLFFGADEKVDLSVEYGSKNKKFKESPVKGLIPLLNSYKFTITENTPIEEDVALDPELLGKVFENLLASYNPETKTTARKQTGSFYTPREIVNYMVDESLIAYLKNHITINKTEEQWDTDLHTLFSFDNAIPELDIESKVNIIKALDKCTILDPACGSGAFPMGILQKMVHVLQKLDPTNELWQEYQLEKAQDESAEAFKLLTKEEREERLKEINNAFDVSLNHPDYARKLFLIENCIYGVDIQPIATQISKLRFFISLVVDQKNSTNSSNNFNVRPLPNLETKFVTANTLIGIEKENNLFSTDEIKELEQQLKTVRHKLFNAKTPRTKRKYREEDEKLRQQIADKLTASGFPLHEAQKLAAWNPYDQNASSPFFDSEWMFDIKDGFDVVIGNPPYFVYEGANKNDIINLKAIKLYKHAFNGKLNAYKLFILKSFSLLNENGVFSEIFQNSFLADNSAVGVRKFFLEQSHIISIDSFPERDNSSKRVFPGVKMSVCILLAMKNKKKENTFFLNVWEARDMKNGYKTNFTPKEIKEMFPGKHDIPSLKNIEKEIFKTYYANKSLGKEFTCYQGELNMSTHREFFTRKPNKYMALKGAQIQQYDVLLNGMSQGEIEFVDIEKYKNKFSSPKSRHHENDRIGMQGITGVNETIRLKAAYVEKGFFCAHSCNYLISNNKTSLWVLLGLLNSNLYNWVFKKTSTNSNVNSYEIQNLTLPNISTEINYIIILISKILSTNKITEIQKVMDAIVYTLYFSDHMKEREINVIDYIEQDIESVLHGRVFDTLSVIEKEGVIDQLHSIWSHPDNEVRNRIALFAVRSPEILKPILES